MNTPTHHIAVDQAGEFVAWTEDPTLRFPEFLRKITTSGWERASWVTPRSPAYWVSNDTKPTFVAPAYGKDNMDWAADEVTAYKETVQSLQIKTTKEYLEYIDTLGVLATTAYLF